jgi:hypothetical protein
VSEKKVVILRKGEVVCVFGNDFVGGWRNGGVTEVS